MKHVSSDLFMQSATLTILPVGDINPTETSIKSFFAEIIQREKEKGNPEVLFDEDLWNLFRNKEPGFSTLFTSIVYRFKKSISTKKVLDQVQEGIKKIYTYTECIAIANASVLANEVDKIETGIIIYFCSK